MKLELNFNHARRFLKNIFIFEIKGSCWCSEQQWDCADPYSRWNIKSWEPAVQLTDTLCLREKKTTVRLFDFRGMILVGVRPYPGYLTRDRDVLLPCLSHLIFLISTLYTSKLDHFIVKGYFDHRCWGSFGNLVLSIQIPVKNSKTAPIPNSVCQPPPPWASLIEIHSYKNSKLNL